MIKVMISLDKEVINGQRSTKRQSRAQETETAESKTDCRSIIVFDHAARVGHKFFTRQEKIAL